MNKRKFFKVWVAKPLAILLLLAIATAAIIGFLLLGKATFKGVIAAADRQAAGEMQPDFHSERLLKFGLRLTSPVHLLLTWIL